MGTQLVPEMLEFVTHVTRLEDSPDHNVVKYLAGGILSLFIARAIRWAHTKRPFSGVLYSSTKF